MSRLHLLSLAALASGILILPVRAQEVGQEAPAARYQLKNRSSFVAKDTGRAPFWPIGHVKRSKYVEPSVAAAPTTQLDPEMFSVTSILMGNPSLAVINGRAYGEGEYLRMARAAAGAKTAKVAALDARIRVRVVRIMDGQVALQSLDGQSLVVPLRRNEVSAPSPNEEQDAPLPEQ